ncbi:MAG: hypothetical protein LBK26_01780 [Rickettsiales bacterium]|jgi:hypothetical protein|nr:hypothetical protein [Rickettsiales bacterium]
MKNFYLIARIIKHHSVIGMIALMSLLASCDKEEHDILPNPVNPVLTDNDTIRISITNVQTLTEAYNKATDAKKFYKLHVANNVLVNSRNIAELRAFGDWKNKNNVAVDWSKIPTKADTDNAINVVVPEETIMLSFDEYQEYGEVPLAPAESTPENAGFVASPKDVEKFADSGVQGVGGYNGENIHIQNADQLGQLIDVIAGYTGSTVTTYTANSDKAKVIFEEDLPNDTKGLKVRNMHMQALATVVGLSDIVNNNLQPGEKDVVANADLLSQFNLVGTDRFNGGNLFKISGADGADRMEGKTNGQYLRTDTASIGHNGSKLDRIIPDKIFIDVNGADAAVLKKLSGWSGGQIELSPQADENLPGGQKALLNHTQATLAMISTPAGGTEGALYKSLVNLVVSRYIKAGTTPNASDFDGAIRLDQFNDSIADMSYQKMDASNKLVGGESKALLNSESQIVIYDCRYHQIMGTKLQSRGSDIAASYYENNKDAQNIFYLINNDEFGVVLPDEYHDTMDGLQLCDLVRSWGFAVTGIHFVRQSMLDILHMHAY